jgi:hypothetical protein
MSKKKQKKEYTSYIGVRNSFIATIALAKHTWAVPPDEAVDWYIQHVKKQQRPLTAATADVYRRELCQEFQTWIDKNTGVTASPDDIDAAINFLEDNGYTITRL